MRIEEERREEPITKYLNMTSPTIRRHMEEQITEKDIKKDIWKMRNREAVGDDEIAGGIVKQNEEWIRKAIKKL